jgi:hypothetical protein
MAAMPAITMSNQTAVTGIDATDPNHTLRTRSREST